MHCPHCKKFIDTKPRSTNQNSYYWGVVLKTIGDHLGYSPQEVHEAMKQEFLTKKEISVAGRVARITWSTTELTTDAMEEYLKNIRIFASTFLNIMIPLPNEIING